MGAFNDAWNVGLLDVSHGGKFQRSVRALHEAEITRLRALENSTLQTLLISTLLYSPLLYSSLLISTLFYYSITLNSIDSIVLENSTAMTGCSAWPRGLSRGLESAASHSAILGEPGARAVAP